MHDLLRYRLTSPRPIPARPHQATRVPQHTVGGHTGCIAELAKAASITPNAMKKRMRRWPPELWMAPKVGRTESARRSAAVRRKGKSA